MLNNEIFLLEIPFFATLSKKKIIRYLNMSFDLFFSFCLTFFNFDEIYISVNYPINLPNFVFLNNSKIFFLWFFKNFKNFNIIKLLLWDRYRYFLLVYSISIFWSLIYFFNFSYFFNCYIRSFFILKKVYFLRKSLLVFSPKITNWRVTVKCSQFTTTMLNKLLINESKGNILLFFIVFF